MVATERLRSDFVRLCLVFLAIYRGANFMSARLLSGLGFGLYFLLAACVSPAEAHFVWIETNAGDQKLLVRSGFGEIGDWDVDLADRMSKSQFWTRSTEGLKPLTLPFDATEKGYRANLSGSLPNAVVGRCDFNVVKLGSKPATWLRYTAKSLVGPPVGWLDTKPTADLRIELLAMLESKDVRLTVLHLGKPLAGAKIKGEGPNDSHVELITDEQGVARWPLNGTGSYACFVGTTVEGSGEQDGKSYESLKDYATLTFKLTEADLTATAHAPNTIPDLPEAVTSFGAAVADGWLYVYSGHIGTAHDHSAENISKAFRRIHLASPTAWEELAKGPPLQGVALTDYKGKLIRVGGMTARNKHGDEEDLLSVADVGMFDPKSNEWSALVSLPEPRSSHDCIVKDDRLYVAGGWNLQGKGKERIWHETAWQLDLSKPGATWEALPTPPFTRRALSVAVAQGRFYVVGGLTPEGTASTEVDVLDLATGAWSKGPELAEGPMQGFGPAALGIGDQLFASPFSGVVSRLEGNTWVECGKLQTPRFLHRLLLGGRNQLLAVAGSSRRGHLASVESLTIGAK
jgi:hypothetical protein